MEDATITEDEAASKAIASRTSPEARAAKIAETEAAVNGSGAKKAKADKEFRNT